MGATVLARGGSGLSRAQWSDCLAQLDGVVKSGCPNFAAAYSSTEGAFGSDSFSLNSDNGGSILRRLWFSLNPSPPKNA
jgi:hypothetical protein